MASRIPMYIPAPNWDIPSDNDIVALGRLITDPENPESRVPRSEIKPIAESDIQFGEKTDWKTTLEQLRSGKIGIWMKCLRVVSGQASFGKLKLAIEEHRFDTLETKYFLPDKEYLAKALNDLRVKGYLEVHRWRKPVYMITGIKIAHGASVTSESKKEEELEAELKANLSSVGAETLGPGGNWTAKDKKGISYTGSTDYVFAYRLLEVKSKRGGSNFSSKPFIKGSLFGNDGDNAADASQREGYHVDDYEDAGLCIADTLEDLEALEAVHD